MVSDGVMNIFRQKEKLTNNIACKHVVCLHDLDVDVRLKNLQVSINESMISTFHNLLIWLGGIGSQSVCNIHIYIIIRLRTMHIFLSSL